MKKLITLLSIVFISFVSFAQIQSVNYYSIDETKNGGAVFYKADSTGGALGVEFVKDGFTYLVVGGGSMPNFSVDNREADTVFRKYIKVGNTYGFISEYRKTISDANYMYGNPSKPTFGNYSDQPYTDSTATNPHILKADLQTEAQFFIDNIIKNKHSLPISISNFIFATIRRTEGI